VATGLSQPQLIAVALGAVGGLFIGKEAHRHLFVTGLDPDERRGLFLFAASALGLWGVQQLVDLDKLGVELTNQVAGQ
jgi:hypothetical protein